jgi:hypothetical protein
VTSFSSAIILAAFCALPSFTLANASSLDGDWRRPCENGVLRSETFAGPQVRFSERFHLDRSCAAPVFELLMDGSFATRGTEIDFLSTQSWARPLEEALAARWNDRAVCGRVDWRAGVAVEVTGLSCDFFLMGSPMRVPPVGLARHGIWKIEGERLYFGLVTREFDASAPARRPREWDPRFYLRVLPFRHFSMR